MRDEFETVEINNNFQLLPSLNSDVYEVLKRYKICLCFADWRDMPRRRSRGCRFCIRPPTFGHAEDGNYSHTELARDIRQIKKWSKQSRDVYIYFNDDTKEYAIENARYVRDRI